MQISEAEIQHSRVALIFFYKIILVWIELPRNNFFFSISIFKFQFLSSYWNFCESILIVSNSFLIGLTLWHP